MTEPNPAIADAPPPPVPVVLVAAAAPSGVKRLSPEFELRVWCTLMMVVCGAMLALGMCMKPSPRGIGTHAESLGVPPCGFQVVTGYPCPTCGCTTAVTYVAHGHVINAFITQPFGAVFGLVGAVLFVLGTAGVITGKWYGPSAFILGWYWKPLVFGGVALLIGGWMYKIAAMKYGWLP